MKELEKHFPGATHADYQENDTVSFTDPVSGCVMQGTVLHSIAPIEQAGRMHPLQYLIDCGDGFPHVITSGDIVEQVG